MLAKAARGFGGLVQTLYTVIPEFSDAKMQCEWLAILPRFLGGSALR